MVSKKVLLLTVAVVALVAIAASVIVINNNNGTQQIPVPDPTPTPTPDPEPDPMDDGLVKTDKIFTNENGDIFDVYGCNYTFETDNGKKKYPVYWSDGYFSQNAYTYNEHLASLSLSVMSGSNAIGAGSKHYPLYEDALTKLGFTDFWANDDYKVTPTDETVGAAFAKKTITVSGESKTIVFVVLRSSNYGKEWANNFLLGDSGEALGFSTAAHKVLGNLNSYLGTNGLDPNDDSTLYWITGYSRGAAIGNLLGKYVIDAYDNSGSRTYDYVFACPAAGVEDAKIGTNNYSGLFTTVDPCDPVPRVAPESWGFIRYGTEITLPIYGQDADAEEKMTKIIEQYFGCEKHGKFYKSTLKFVKNVPIIPTTSKSSSQSDFLDDLFDLLADDCNITREEYAANMQPIVRKIIVDDSTNNLSALVTVMLPVLRDIYENGKNITDLEKYTDDLVSDMDMSVIMACFGMTEEEAEYASRMFIKIAYYDDKEASWLGFIYIGTLVNSAEDIVDYHFPIYYGTWIMSFDSYYDDLVKS